MRLKKKTQKCKKNSKVIFLKNQLWTFITWLQITFLGSVLSQLKQKIIQHTPVYFLSFSRIWQSYPFSECHSSASIFTRCLPIYLILICTKIFANWILIFRKLFANQKEWFWNIWKKAQRIRNLGKELCENKEWYIWRWCTLWWQIGVEQSRWMKKTVLRLH